MRQLHLATAMAFVAMSGAFVWWNWQAFADPGALLLVAPLVLVSAFVFRRTVRPLVVAGALALPYLCIALVEIIAANAARSAPIIAVACGVLFMALLGPATRNAKRAAQARSAAKESS